MTRKADTKYGCELKLEAVRMSGDIDHAANQIASKLGVPVSQLRKWKRDLECEAVNGTPPLAGSEVRHEVARLRDEIQRLKKEKQLLTKVVISLIPGTKQDAGSNTDLKISRKSA